MSCAHQVWTNDHSYILKVYTVFFMCIIITLSHNSSTELGLLLSSHFTDGKAEAQKWLGKCLQVIHLVDSGPTRLRASLTKVRNCSDWQPRLQSCLWSAEQGCRISHGGTVPHQSCGMVIYQRKPGCSYKKKRIWILGRGSHNCPLQWDHRKSFTERLFFSPGWCSSPFSKNRKL